MPTDFRSSIVATGTKYSVRVANQQNARTIIRDFFVPSLSHQLTYFSTITGKSMREMMVIGIFEYFTRISPDGKIIFQKLEICTYAVCIVAPVKPKLY